MRTLRVVTLIIILIHAALISPTSGVQAPMADVDGEEQCPDYAIYSKFPHHPRTDGLLALPYQRPSPQCRTFTSSAIEQVITDITFRIEDPDLARLFENAFPSTTDTTVKFHTDGSNTHPQGSSPGQWQGAHSFIITGDIVAEWLRDSANQLEPYQPLARKDPAIYALILGAINTQAEYVAQFPYCNAFQPPPISNLPSEAGQIDNVTPAPEPSVVFECKYELDSLAHFLSLANQFYKHTGSVDFVTERWIEALESLLSVLEEQSQPTFDPETGQFVKNEYTFRRRTDTGTETLSLHGVGNPLRRGTGLVRSAFRPSDDATILGFLIPSNAMMAVELERAVEFLEASGQEPLAARVEEWSQTIRKGIWDHAVVKHRVYGDVFAYEVDGYGSSILMDDANYPSLLALPLIGFVSIDDETYQNTRRMVLDRDANPYYLSGRGFRGVGGPHIGLENAWPMSVLFQAMTSNDDDEIQICLDLVLKASQLGLVHESVSVNNRSSYTRSWFAWANGVFANTILDIARRKPHLIFTNSLPYVL